MKETGHEVRVPAKSYPRYSKLPGYVIHNDAEGVHLHDLHDGTSTLLHAGTAIGAQFSPRGEYVQAWSDAKQFVYSTRTGERSPVPTGVQVGWPGGSGSDHYALRFSHLGPTLLVDLRTGSTSELSPDPNRAGRGWGAVRVLDDERILQINDNGRVDVYDRSGTKLRTAWDPSKDN